MWKLVGWTCIAVIPVGALWELSRSNPTFPPWIMGTLLLGIGLLVGLRIGSDSTSAFVKDVLQLNKYLGEQNNELSELNHSHIKRQLAEDSGVEVPDSLEEKESEV